LLARKDIFKYKYKR